MRLQLGLFCSVGLLAACATPAAPIASPEPPPSEPAAPVAAPEADVAAEPAPEPLEFVWVSDTGAWNADILVSGAGWVVTSGRGDVVVHASDTGKVVEKARLCSVVDGGLSLIDDTRALAVCRSGGGSVRSIEFPGLSSKVEATLKARSPNVAAFAPGLVAVGSNDGPVQVLETSGFQEVDSFTMAEGIEGLAFSRDGALLAVGVDDETLHVRDLTSKTTVEIKGPHTSRRPTALSFSPDGSHLFAHDGSFKASVFELKTGAVVSTHRTGSWLIESQWVDATHIAATGSDGFVVYELGNSQGQKLSAPNADRGSTKEGLGMSADGKVLCSGDRDGVIACFARGPMPANTYEPAPQRASASASVGSSNTPAAPAGPVSEGTIRSRKGDTLRLEHLTGSAPKVGDKGTLTRYFERRFMGGLMTGWMEIALVEVTGVDGSVVRAKILSESANITINGKKQDQFKVGFKTRLQVDTPAP